MLRAYGIAPAVIAAGAGGVTQAIGGAAGAGGILATGGAILGKVSGVASLVGKIKGLFGGGNNPEVCVDFCSGDKVGSAKKGGECRTKYPNAVSKRGFGNQEKRAHWIANSGYKPCAQDSNLVQVMDAVAQDPKINPKTNTNIPTGLIIGLGVAGLMTVFVFAAAKKKR